MAQEMVRKSVCEVLPLLPLLPQDRRDAQMFFSYDSEPTERHYEYYSQLKTTSARNIPKGNLKTLVDAVAHLVRRIDGSIESLYSGDGPACLDPYRLYHLIPGPIGCEDFIKLRVLLSEITNPTHTEYIDQKLRDLILGILDHLRDVLRGVRNTLTDQTSVLKAHIDQNTHPLLRAVDQIGRNQKALEERLVSRIDVATAQLDVKQLLELVQGIEKKYRESDNQCVRIDG